MELLLSHHDIRVRLGDDRLEIANAALRRELDLSLGAPRTVSLSGTGMREFAAAGKAGADLAFAGLRPPGRPDTPWRLESVAAEAAGDGAVVTLEMLEPVGATRYRREYFIYPELPALGVGNALRSAVMPDLFWSPRLREAVPEPCLGDGLRMATGLAFWRAVEFRGCTDIAADYVIEHAAPAPRLNGNFLLCRDAAGMGFGFIQEAPPSRERRDHEEYDFRVDGDEILSCTWGIHPAELRPEIWHHGYRHAVFLFRNPEEAGRVLKRYWRCRYPDSPGGAPAVTVNPWGSGNFPERVGEAFLLGEIAASREVGADQYQVDDGWQEGKSLGELTQRNRHITPEFWRISDTVGGDAGMRRLAEAARANGVALGLWFAPSCNCEYRDWPLAAELLIDFRRRYGIENFKIDAMKLRTYEAEANIRRLFDAVRREGGDGVQFDLDVTNGQRAGYLRLLEYGRIFLENRFVNYPGSIFYSPETTLRNLWHMAHYLRLQTLQVEIPNPEDFDPACGPPDAMAYPVEYWAAIALLANPLLWFTPSTMTPPMRRRIHGMMDLHHQIRPALLAGLVAPVGMPPDGRSLTGFRLNDDSGAARLVLLFRERNCPEEHLCLPDSSEWRLLGGGGTRTESGFTVAEPASFALFAGTSRRAAEAESPAAAIACKA